MRGLAPLGIVAIAAASLSAARQPATVAPRDRVALSVAVVDDGGRTVSGLTRAAFSIKEDGQPIGIDGFRVVSAGNDGARRGLVVLLDDANTSPVYTVNVQTIARAFLARANAPDFASVTIFSHRNDELAVDSQQLAARIDGFIAGTKMIFGAEALAYSMRRMASLAREIEQVSGDRKTIVCVGAPRVFDMNEPAASSALTPAWSDLMRTLAHTRTSVYLIDPSGLTGRPYLHGTGLIVDSGGAAFLNSNDFAGAVDRIWSEAGHSYVLEYTPTGAERPLHSIDVSVRGRGLHAHAVHYRGDYHPPPDASSSV
jgi:hypothetical protein